MYLCTCVRHAVLAGVEYMYVCSMQDKTALRVLFLSFSWRGHWPAVCFWWLALAPCRTKSRLRPDGSKPFPHPIHSGTTPLQYASRPPPLARPTIRRAVPLAPKPARYYINAGFPRSSFLSRRKQDLHQINRAVRASDTEDDAGSSNPPRAKRAKSSSSSSLRPPR